MSVGWAMLSGMLHSQQRGLGWHRLGGRAPPAADDGALHAPTRNGGRWLRAAPRPGTGAAGDRSGELASTGHSLCLLLCGGYLPECGLWGEGEELPT